MTDVKELDETCLAVGLELCFAQPWRLVEDDLLEFLVLCQTAGEGRLSLRLLALPDLHQILQTWRVVGDIRSERLCLQRRAQRDDIVVLRLDERGQCLQRIPDGMRRIFHGQAAVGRRRTVVVEQRREVGGEGAKAVGTDLDALGHIGLAGQDGQVVLFTVAAQLAVGGQSYRHDSMFLVRRIVEGEQALAVGLGREGFFLLEKHALGLGVEDLQERRATDVGLGQVLHGGTQTGVVTCPQETRHEEARHQFLAGDGLAAERGAHHVLGVCQSQQLPRRQALGQREFDADFALGIRLQTWQEGCRLVEVSAYGRTCRSHALVIPGLLGYFVVGRLHS